MRQHWRLLLSRISGKELPRWHIGPTGISDAVFMHQGKCKSRMEVGLFPGRGVGNCLISCSCGKMASARNLESCVPDVGACFP